MACSDEKAAIFRNGQFSGVFGSTDLVVGNRDNGERLSCAKDADGKSMSEETELRVMCE